MLPQSAKIRTRFMDAAQFRWVLDILRLSQAEAASYLGVSLRTANGYANGAPIPNTVAILLKLLAGGAVTVEEVEAVR
jgi:hypothetical protein